MILDIEIAFFSEFIRNCTIISFFHLFKEEAGAVFTPTGEVQRSLVAPWDVVGKAAKVFFREERVEGLYLTILWVALGEAVVHMEREEAPEEEEGTPGEAVEIVYMIPVGVEEAHTTLVKISRVNAVLTGLVTVG